MKSKMLALLLFALTAMTVSFFASQQPVLAGASPTNGTLPGNGIAPVATSQERPLVEVVFVLDTTGSMGGLIDAAKEKIWSIASNLASAQPVPEIRMGLVAYRDRGDAYVTRTVDLSHDLDSIYATLMDFQASGGGDTPESVNQALHDAVHKISWSNNTQSYKTVFLFGDAPAHTDYQDDVSYEETAAIARQRGIVINTVQCGEDELTTREWEQIAQLGDGRYFQVAQAGSAVAIHTPFDKKLAELSASLDDTRLYYGNEEEKARQREKTAATKKLQAGSSVESLARRATFNASTSGSVNFLGEGELVDDVASGRVDLSTIDQDALPEPLQAMAPEAQQAEIEEKAERRQALQAEIKEVAAQREVYLKQAVEKAGGAKDSLDAKIYGAVREQARDKGLSYEADELKY